MPPQTPELEIWVDGRLWTRVDAFFGHGPTERDLHRARRRRGPQLRAVRRRRDRRAAALGSEERRRASTARGIGAHGPLKPGRDADARASGRRGFDKVSLAGIVAGGADAEDGEKAREAAPGKVQSLGRLVSIRDYETETLGVPGVVDRRGGVGPARRRAGGDPARAARGRPRGRVRRRARDARARAALPRSRPLPARRRAGAAALRVRSMSATRAIRRYRQEDVDAAICAPRSAWPATRTHERSGAVRPARAPPRRARIREPHRGPAAERAGRAVVQGHRARPVRRPASPIRRRWCCRRRRGRCAAVLPCSAARAAAARARAPHADGRVGRAVGRESAHERARPSRCSIGCPRSTARATPSSRRRTSCAPTSPRSKRPFGALHDEHRPALRRPLHRHLRRLGHPVPRRPARHDAPEGRAAHAARRRRRHDRAAPAQGHAGRDRAARGQPHRLGVPRRRAAREPRLGAAPQPPAARCRRRAAVRRSAR